MKLEIQSLWSPDLNPPSEGLPRDICDFDVFMQVSIGESDKPGGEVFNFSVVSPSQLATYESGRFISNTLVLERFDWTEIYKRLQKLFMHAASAGTWDQVIEAFKGQLQYAD